MSTRIHLVLSEEEKARFEEAARREGMTLSAWLREAAREGMRKHEPPALSSVSELEAFFRECETREEGQEPDWEAHRKVIESSLREGAPET